MEVQELFTPYHGEAPPVKARRNGGPVPKGSSPKPRVSTRGTGFTGCLTRMDESMRHHAKRRLGERRDDLPQPDTARRSREPWWRAGRIGRLASYYLKRNLRID